MSAFWLANSRIDCHRTQNVVLGLPSRRWCVRVVALGSVRRARRAVARSSPAAARRSRSSWQRRGQGRARGPPTDAAPHYYFMPLRSFTLFLAGFGHVVQYGFDAFSKGVTFLGFLKITLILSAKERYVSRSGKRTKARAPP